MAPCVTVTDWFRKLKSKPDIPAAARGSGKSPFKRLVANVKETAAHHSRSLRKSWLHFGALENGPSQLSAEHKRTGVETPRRMHRHLSSAVHKGSHLLLRGDGSWFYVNSYPQIIWPQRNGTRPVRERKFLSSLKVLLPVFWSLTRFALIEPLPKGQTFSLLYCSQTIRTTLPMKCPSPTNRRPAESAWTMLAPIDQE
jgi:hypothetical protein